MLKLGPLRLKNQFLLSPMESVSDIAFRKLCYSLGASFTYTEMIRGASFLRENSSTLNLIDTFDAATPTGVQFMAKSPSELQKLLGKFFELRKKPAYKHFQNIRSIDLNFGCPSPDIIRIGAGPAMLKRTARMEAMFKTLATVKAHDASIAVSVKLRLGLNQREQELKVIHRFLEAANEHLDFLTVHGKHAGQKGRARADWQALAELRELVTIPFIANGGALDAERAQELLKFTKADGIMIARGATQNPWIFRGLTDGSEQPTRDEIEQALKEYRVLAAQHHIQKKYIEFHEKNFAKLLRETS